MWLGKINAMFTTCQNKSCVWGMAQETGNRWGMIKDHQVIFQTISTQQNVFTTKRYIELGGIVKIIIII